MINELIEKIGGRERLEFLSEYRPNIVKGQVSFREVKTMARALLAVLDAKPIAYTHESEISNMHVTGLYIRGFPIDRRLNAEEGYTVPLYTIETAASAPEGWLLIPAIPSQSHLNSIAMRYRHDFYLLPDTQRESVLSTARQMYEECSGQGFYSIPKPAAPAPGGDGG